jgi:hypothetical protein
MQPETTPISSVPRPAEARRRPERVILVYDGDSGLRAMLLDVVKKAVGHEECALCEITYSAVGKRGAWKRCEQRLGVEVAEMHRDQLPSEWAVPRSDLPCIRAQAGDERPFVFVRREDIVACHGSVEALEGAILGAMNREDS